jgi:Carbohydrate-selective porin, OprB family/S-layer homology domain
VQNIWKFLAASPAIFGAIFAVNTTAVAQEKPVMPEVNEAPATIKNVTPVANLIQESRMAQVTSVSQLSDVQPTDWAFQALQSLVERYGCIAGYPNATYRGNRAMTRYEFAAGLNACLERVNELIATATGDLVRKEDLEGLRRLQEEFATELATLRGRVDALEAKTSELEANQFSTTTKLQGQVVAVFSDVLSGENVSGVNPQNDNNTTFGARARIELVSSFTGKDTLLTRIQTNNILGPDIGTSEGSLFFAGEDGNMNAAIDALFYKFPLGEQTEVIAIANAGAADDLTSTINLFDGDGAFGAISTFGTRNSIYYQMDGAGLGINQNFGDSLALSLGYLAGESNNPEAKSGLFDGAYGAMAQLTFQPSDRFKIGLTYINSYKQELGTGSFRANPISALSTVDFDLDGEEDGLDVPFSSNSYGLQASLGISEKFVLGGWVGYTNSRNVSTKGGLVDRGSLDIWNWAVTLGFPDLGKKGNLAGIIFGMEPRVTSSSIDGYDKDRDTSYHIEAFYQYQVSDNISITPGVIWLTAPDHNSNNDDVVIGALRTTFSF